MNTNTLKEHINKIIHKLPSDLINNGAEDALKLIIYCYRNNILDDFIREISKDSKLNIFNEKMIHIANTGRRIEYSNLAAWLIFRSIQVGSDEALLNLERYISEPNFICLEIKLIGGVEVTKIYSINKFIELVPFDSILNRRLFRTEKGIIGFGQIQRPKAALIRRFLHPRVHLEPGEKWEKAAKYSGFSQELEDARLFLTPVVLKGPVSLGTFFITDDYVPCLGGMGGHGQSPSFVELKGIKKINSDDFSRFKNIFEKFAKIDSINKAKLLIPLQRLNSATSRYSNIDSAIDLGISMEALFLTKLGEDQGELSFRLRLRAAKLLGIGDDDKSHLFNIFNNLYKMRSSAVHKGVLKEKYGGESTNNLLEEGFLHMGKAIEMFIDRGGYVDWDKIVLN